MSTKIKVCIRLRPFLQQEIAKGYLNSKISVDKKSQMVILQDQQKHKSYKFDHVFNDDSTQQDIYDEPNINNLLDKVIEGYHSTIFAYGQTGSGKTYTMEGFEYEIREDKPKLKQQQSNEVNFGLIPRIATNLFEKLKQKEGQYNVQCSFLQIYNEKIYDLLNMEQNSLFLNQGLRLRWNKVEQFTVENLFIFDCKNAEEVLNLFNFGIQNRFMATHKLNLASSRSHTILTLRIETIDPRTNCSLTSKLELIDLAGSERIGITGTEGKLAKESIDINKSLFILRQVISQLSDIHKNNKKSQEYQHIPFRESKLTSLLKQSIGGNSYCLMFACINPCDLFLEDNIQTLGYATKATFIRNQPVRNDDPSYQLIVELKNANVQLREELKRANEHIQFLNLLKKNETLSEDLCGKISGKEKQAIVAKNIDQGVYKEKLQQQQDHIQMLQMQNYQLIQQNNCKQNNDYDNFSERLLESIDMVRDLLANNKELRETTDECIQKKDVCEKELFYLQKENQELRDKIMHLKNNFNIDNLHDKKKENVANIFNNQCFNTSINWKTMSQQELISEILALRRDKMLLERFIQGDQIGKNIFQNSSKVKDVKKITSEKLQSRSPNILQNKNVMKNNLNDENAQKDHQITTNFGKYTFYSNTSIQSNHNSNQRNLHYQSDDQAYNNQSTQFNNNNNNKQNNSTYSQQKQENIPEQEKQYTKQVNVQQILSKVGKGNNQVPLFQNQLEQLKKQTLNIKNNLQNRSISINNRQQQNLNLKNNQKLSSTYTQNQ